MKYTKEEAFEEVMRRGKILKRRNAKRSAGVLAASACFIMAALIMVIGRLGSVGGSMGGKSAYGAFLLPVEAGGYVLASVIAFAVGVGVTVWILKYRKNHEE